MSDLWQGLRDSARSSLQQRDYASKTFFSRLSGSGIEVSDLLSADRSDPEVVRSWIPGVEFFRRSVYPQRHRGYFAEFARRDEGLLAEIGFWPGQWATARMFANTAKGFHIHPPFIPEKQNPVEWFQRLFIENPKDYTARPYSREQWDVMFFVQGSVEMILVDERAGLERKVMRFLIEGDDRPGPNNAGVVIPAGVAHAVKTESSTDVIMVYGTSTRFNPEFEGRIASGIETAQLPPDWQEYLKRV